MPPTRRQYEAEGHDMQSLLFNFLDELLFAFSTDFFVPQRLNITLLDREAWRIQAQGCVAQGMWGSGAIIGSAPRLLHRLPGAAAAAPAGRAACC